MEINSPASKVISAFSFYILTFALPNVKIRKVDPGAFLFFSKQPQRKGTVGGSWDFGETVQVLDSPFDEWRKLVSYVPRGNDYVDIKMNKNK